MGGIVSKAPDTSKQSNELARQQQEAEQRAASEAQARTDEMRARRRRQRGRASLLATEGGELGVTTRLGGN